MLNPSRPHADFLVETQCEFVPQHVMQQAALVAQDSQSTIRERMLAGCILELANSFNKMIMSLEHGTVTLRVFEENIHRNQKRDE